MVDLKEELEYWYGQEQNVTLYSFWDAKWTVAFGDIEGNGLEDRQYDLTLDEVAEWLHSQRGRR